jgi:VWFA-related protein
MRSLVSIVAVAGLLMSLTLSAHRQGSSLQAPPADAPVFRSRTNLILLQVNVFDGRSTAISELPQDAFRVYEDGVEQRIEFFRAREVPVASGLIIDHSSSMLTRQNMVRAGVSAFAESSRDTDELFTIIFNEHVRFGLPEGVPFTRSRPLLLSALTRQKPGGLTAIYDAVIEGISHLADSSLQKRALVVLSDGKDNASHQSRSNMLYRAAQSNALIYTIWTGDLANDAGDQKVLRELASRTGGVTYSPRSEADVVSAFTEIAANIRRGYSIGYTPTNSATDGSYRQVKVAVQIPGRKLNVRTRDGYIAADDSEPGSGQEALPPR